LQAEKIAQPEKACADEAGKGNCYRWVMEAIRKTQDVHKESRAGRNKSHRSSCSGGGQNPRGVE
jgi:hypothetical protein